MRRILTLFSALALAACAPPGQQTFAPKPVTANAQSINAANAFAGRIALVSIAPGTQDFKPALKQAVAAALAIKPEASFEIQAETPNTGDPDKDAAALAAMVPEVHTIAAALREDGVAEARITRSARVFGSSSAYNVFVK